MERRRVEAGRGIMADEQRRHAGVSGDGRHGRTGVVRVNNVRPERQSRWLVYHEVATRAHLLRERPEQWCEHDWPVPASPQSVSKLLDHHLGTRPAGQCNVRDQNRPRHNAIFLTSENTAGSIEVELRAASFHNISTATSRITRGSQDRLASRRLGLAIANVYSDSVEDGGLFSYGVTGREIDHRAANHVDRAARRSNEVAQCLSLAPKPTCRLPRFLGRRADAAFYECTP